MPVFSYLWLNSAFGLVYALYMFADLLPNDCDDTYSIQTNTVCNGISGTIQLNISDDATKLVYVNSYGIENCSVCHNFTQVNFTFHSEKLSPSKGRTCLNGTMDTTTVSFTPKTSNMIGKFLSLSLSLSLSQWIEIKVLKDQLFG